MRSVTLSPHLVCAQCARRAYKLDPGYSFPNWAIILPSEARSYSAVYDIGRPGRSVRLPLLLVRVLAPTACLVNVNRCLYLELACMISTLFLQMRGRRERSSSNAYAFDVLL